MVVIECRDKAEGLRASKFEFLISRDADGSVIIQCCIAETLNAIVQKGNSNGNNNRQVEYEKFSEFSQTNIKELGIIERDISFNPVAAKQ